MTQSFKAWRLLPLLVMLALVLTGCGDPYLSALNPSGPVAEEQLSLIYISLAVMIFVIVAVIVIYTYVLIRFRARPGQTEIPKQVEGSHTLEIIWTVIPILLLIIIAVPTVMTTFSLADETGIEEGLRVNVVAHQYWWEFEYPEEGIYTAQELVIPKDTWVFFELTAPDNGVIHSFWVPALGGKMDTNPGLVNRMKLKADKVGTFHGKCAELCGASHALMDFKVTVVEQEEYDVWAQKMMASQHVEPTTAVAQQGREIYANQCIGCHAIDANTKSPYPNLAGFADRQYVAGWWINDEKNLTEWIKNPQGLKPGNVMPDLGLSDEEVAAVVEYMKTLKLE
ncbi:cytochrome c oxidase subunit II [Caldalkalibacillus mannanilyticus]|uniref:cytochrome c oxidase subunit II n=1 Tax=Caldalkalibacillus mannanilyticus TaxID=1418 RepID=UPI000469819F|nr:cytochrome c oxidase subunit II [Caldalkalibacillus mannanilyticus]